MGEAIVTVKIASRIQIEIDSFIIYLLLSFFHLRTCSGHCNAFSRWSHAMHLLTLILVGTKKGIIGTLVLGYKHLKKYDWKTSPRLSQALIRYVAELANRGTDVQSGTE